MAVEDISSNFFPRFPAGELLADRVDGEARGQTRLMYLFLLVFPLLAATYGFLAPMLERKTFEAKARLEVVENQPPRFGAERLQKQGMRDQAEMLSSERFRALVYQNLPAQYRLRLPGGKRAQTKRRGLPTDPLVALTGLKAKPDGDNYLLDITFRNPDQELAVAVVKVAVNQAQDEGLRRSSARAAQAAKFLGLKLDEVAARIEQEQAAVDRFDAANGPGELTIRTKKVTSLAAMRTMAALRAARKGRKNRGYTGNQSKSTFEFAEQEQDTLLAELQKADSRAVLVRETADAKLAVINSLVAEGKLGVLDYAGDDFKRERLTDLRSHLALAKASFASLAMALGPRNPVLLEEQGRIDQISKDLDDAEQRVLVTGRLTAELARKNEAQIGAALAQRRKEVSQVAESGLGNEIAELELAIDLTVYEDFLLIRDGQPAQLAMETPSLQMVDEPGLPLKPVQRPIQREVAIDTFLGLVFGFLVAAILFVRRIGVWRTGHAETAAGLRMITILPALPEPPKGQIAQRDGNIAALIGLGEGYAYGMEELRQNVVRLSSAMEVRSIVLSSASPAEGKTTAATYLAVRLALGGERVLLIDADLHRPAVHRRMGLPGRVGLSQVLSGTYTLAEAVQPFDAAPGLDVLVAGPIPPRPSELLQSPPMADLLEAARAGYRYVVIDTAPILAAADAVYLAERSEVLFMIARFGKVELRILRAARKILSRSQVPFAAMIVNGVKATRWSRLGRRFGREVLEG